MYINAVQKSETTLGKYKIKSNAKQTKKRVSKMKQKPKTQQVKTKN